MIILVFGLPGTGKSYFSEKLADLLQATHLDTDTERRRMDLPDENTTTINYMVYEQLLKEVTAQIQYKKMVIVDGTFHKEKVRNLFIEKARELRQDVILIEIKADDDIVHERLKSRPEYSDADFKVYLQIKSRFEPVYQQHLVLWSTESIDDMLDKAKNYIYGKTTDETSPN
jgi:predicted kinase